MYISLFFPFFRSFGLILIEKKVAKRKYIERNPHTKHTCNNEFLLKDLLFLIVNKAGFLCVCLHVSFVDTEAHIHTHTHTYVCPNKNNKKGVGLIQFID